MLRIVPSLRSETVIVNSCSPDERSEIRGKALDAVPGYRCAHPGYEVRFLVLAACCARALQKLFAPKSRGRGECRMRAAPEVSRAI